VLHRPNASSSTLRGCSGALWHLSGTVGAGYDAPVSAPANPGVTRRCWRGIPGPDHTTPDRSALNKRALAALDIPAPAVDKVLRITDKVRRGIAMLVSGECKNPTDAAVRTGKAIQRASQTQQMAFCVMRAAHDSPAGSLGSRIST
jgi:hypothetical protein